MTPLLAAILLKPAAPDVAFDYASPKGLIVVTTEGAGGKPLKVLVDTGAQRTVVDRALADALKLEKGEEVKARGQGGTVEAYFVKGLRLSALSEAPLDAVALPLDGLGKAIGTPIDVILGEDVLGKRVVDIDPVERKVAFGSRPPAVSTYDTVVSLDLRSGRPHVPATVGLPDGGNARAMLLLDTGSDAVAELAQPFADGIGLATRPDPQGRSTLGVGGTVALRLADLLGLSVGRETVGPDDVRVFGRPVDAAGDGDGRVGNGFLARYRTTIDGPGLRLVLSPIRKP